VLTETWLVPIEGYLIDKFGPRIMISGSGVLVAIAWVINSVADSLALLYLGAAIGGIGAGVIYGGSVGNSLKWVPDRPRRAARPARPPPPPRLRRGPRAAGRPGRNTLPVEGL